MFENILFDLDGTLTDPAEGITNSVRYALAKFGIGVKDARELYKFIGPPLLDSFADFYGFSRADAVTALAFYREYFADKGIFENAVYPDIPHVLAELAARGKRLILATSKPEEYAARILEHFSLNGYFDFVGGASMDETRSKKADVIAYALNSCGIGDGGKSTTVMIGDRLHDIVGAKENGLHSVGVLYGYGSREELTAAGATYIAETVDDILHLV